jgi:hypothetical protein
MAERSLTPGDRLDQSRIIETTGYGASGNSTQRTFKLLTRMHS